MKTYLLYSTKKSIRNSLLVLFGSLSVVFGATQTELQLYDITFTENYLHAMLDSEREAFAQWVEGNEEELAIVSAVKIDLVHSDNNALIESSIINGQRVITISDAFLKTLAKISDAIYIQGNIDNSKHVEDYIHYCVERSGEVPNGPIQFFNLNRDQAKTYCNNYHFAGRQGIFLLAVRFVLAHEMTHQLYHFAPDAPAEKIDQEIEADDMALAYFRESGWPSIMVIQTMLYFHELDKKKENNELIFTHPSGLERISAMCNASLTNLLETYNTMASRGPVEMSYQKMRELIEGIYFDVNSQILDDMDQDYDTYLQLAENGNLAAQIKMGMMYFKGTDGWEKNEAEGFRWLTIASERSELGGLLLGMFHEKCGHKDMAIAAYESNVKSYFSGILVTYLYGWNATSRTDYENLMMQHMAYCQQRCIDSCRQEFGYSQAECDLYYCNHSVKNLFNYLMRFRQVNRI